MQVFWIYRKQEELPKSDVVVVSSQNEAFDGA
jgi:hypothetical protein